MGFRTTDEIVAYNEKCGQFYFSPDTMAFFNSRVEGPEVFGGRYFVTSEQYEIDHPRLYTVREASENGRIDTVGDFQAYETLEEAQDAARRAAEVIEQAREVVEGC
jgi:hypothetical protein